MVLVEHRVSQVGRGAPQVGRQGIVVAAHHGRVEGRGNPADHVVGGALVTGDADVVGIDVAQVDALLVGAGDELRGPAWNVDLNGVEEFRVDHGVPGCPQALSQGDRVAVHPSGDVAQSLGSVEGGVHGSHVGQQCLGGADVACGLVAADVLLAGLQRKPVGRLAVSIY